MYNFVYKLHSNELYMQIIIYFLKTFLHIYNLFNNKQITKSQNRSRDNNICIYENNNNNNIYNIQSFSTT